MRNEELLRRLTQLWGVAGYEAQVRQALREEVAPYADSLEEDAMGNLIAVKKGQNGKHKKKIMLAAHMDEIGFMVKTIEESGLLRVCNMGWNWAASAYNGRVRFQNGVSGVVGCQGDIHKVGNDVGKLYVDIGAVSRADAERYVKLGDCCGYHGEYLPLAGELVCAKSLDDRIGCFQLVEALKENDGQGPNDVYYVFTVQEELGCRGSKPAAARIQPDIGIAVDITPAHDVPCDLEGSNRVGGGIAIKIADPSVVADPYVVEAMEACCQQESIPCQREVIDKGGTDASSMNQAAWGCRTGGISVVTRYPHCQSCVASKADMEAGIRLLAALTRWEFTKF